MPCRRQSDAQPGAREAPEPQRRPHRSALFTTPTPPDARQEEAVCVAVFQYQLRQPLADAPPPLRYYLARQGRDPSGTLLGLLQRLAPGVQPFSQCRVSGRDGVVDRTTGARGVILQVTRLTWRHVTAADVVGGYYLTHRQAASFRYDLEHRDGRWAVTAAHLLWRV
jgi:hypothetical protein